MRTRRQRRRHSLYAVPKAAPLAVRNLQTDVLELHHQHMLALRRDRPKVFHALISQAAQLATKFTKQFNRRRSHLVFWIVLIASM